MKTLTKATNEMANPSGHTLGSVLKTEDRGGASLRSQSNRTLLDIIREDPSGGGNSKESRKSWKRFKEKLRLRRQGSGNSWTSSVPVPASDVPLQPSSSSRNRMMMTRRDSTRLNAGPIHDGSAQPDVDLSSGVPRSRSAMLQRNDSRAVHRPSGRYDNMGGFDIDQNDDNDDDERAREGEEEETGEEGEGESTEEGGGGGDGQPERMSLMALLAETDRQMGLDGSSYMMDEDDDDDDDEEVEEKGRGGVGGGGGGGGYNNCCVCMVRHKGAAFIPCGHTFCRLCSKGALGSKRELPTLQQFHFGNS